MVCNFQWCYLQKNPMQFVHASFAFVSLVWCQVGHWRRQSLLGFALLIVAQHVVVCAWRGWSVQLLVIYLDKSQVFEAGERTWKGLKRGMDLDEYLLSCTKWISSICIFWATMPLLARTSFQQTRRRLGSEGAFADDNKDNHQSLNNTLEDVKRTLKGC